MPLTVAGKVFSQQAVPTAAEMCPQFAIATAQQLLQPKSELGVRIICPREAGEQHEQAPRPAGMGQQQGL